MSNAAASVTVVLHGNHAIGDIRNGAALCGRQESNVANRFMTLTESDWT
jgi:hypothetical protein